MTWDSKTIIKTPKGDFTPTTDDLTAELHKAAATCGYTSFRVFIDGNLVDDPAGLHTNSIKALASAARIEGVDSEIRIGSYDKPA